VHVSLAVQEPWPPQTAELLLNTPKHDATLQVAPVKPELQTHVSVATQLPTPLQTFDVFAAETPKQNEVAGVAQLLPTNPVLQAQVSAAVQLPFELQTVETLARVPKQTGTEQD